jgi:hypothetical protein
MATTKATQSFVPVKEVRNGVIILKNDGYRGILMCSSINFALKGEDEQKAIIGGFQSLLNTLDFTIEIVVHSRKTDIRPYLALLETRMADQSTELMRLQLREYIAFIRNFIDSSDIMTKMFYVVVPYSPSVGGTASSALSFLGNKPGPASHTEGAEGSSFEEYRVQLEQRMALVVSGLAASGVRAIPLGTEEIIELLYRSFNLSELESPIHLSA